MTKKDFKEMVSVHNYGRGRRPENLIAIFFDWQSYDKDGKYFCGYKYCIFARVLKAKRDELMNMLYDFIHGNIENVPWYVQLIIAQTDEQRFKVPLDSGGLNCMIKR